MSCGCLTRCGEHRDVGLPPPLPRPHADQTPCAKLAARLLTACLPASGHACIACTTPFCRPRASDQCCARACSRPAAGAMACPESPIQPVRGLIWDGHAHAATVRYLSAQSRRGRPHRIACIPVWARGGRPARCEPVNSIPAAGSRSVSQATTHGGNVRTNELIDACAHKEVDLLELDRSVSSTLTAG